MAQALPQAWVEPKRVGLGRQHGGPLRRAASDIAAHTASGLGDGGSAEGDPTCP